MTTIIVIGIIIAGTSTTSFEIGAAGDLTSIKNRLRSPQSCLPYSRWNLPLMFGFKLGRRFSMIGHRTYKIKALKPGIESFL
jgi:hypothetical protein